MGPMGCPETSVTNYQLTLRNIAEERMLQLHREGSVKSRTETRFARISVAAVADANTAGDIQTNNVTSLLKGLFARMHRTQKEWQVTPKPRWEVICLIIA